MQREKIKTIVCWCLTAACMIVIFWLSSRTSNESNQQSSAVLQWLTAHFGDNFFTSFIVRKLAHFLEFTGLSFLFNISLLQTKKRKMPIMSTALTSLYAVSDELHQIFVDGRSCQLSDWAIDTAGAVLGSIAFLLILILISHINKKEY